MNGGLTLSLAYGIRVLSKNDPFIALSERVSEALQSLSNPHTFIVDSIPLFRYIPQCFPGAKRIARGRHPLAARLRDAPFAAAQKDIVGVSFYLPTALLTVFRSQADGVATPSFVSRCLENFIEEDGDKSGYEIIKDTAGVFFLGASSFVLRFDFFQEIPKLGQALQVLLYIR